MGGYKGNGTIGSCVDNCLDYCMNDGTCVKKEGKPYCQCAGSFNGKNCEEKSEFAYIAGGIAGAVLFIIVLVLLIWMICVRSGRGKRPWAGEVCSARCRKYQRVPGQLLLRGP